MTDHYHPMTMCVHHCLMRDFHIFFARNSVDDSEILMDNFPETVSVRFRNCAREPERVFRFLTRMDQKSYEARRKG